MARRSPAKQPRPEPAPILSRLASTISDWRVLLGAALALVAAGGVAYAFKDSLATKAELAAATQPLVEHVARHDVDNARLEQKVDDVAATVHRIEQVLIHR